LIGVRTRFGTIAAQTWPIFENRKFADPVLGPYQSRRGGKMDHQTVIGLSTSVVDHIKSISSAVQPMGKPGEALGEIQILLVQKDVYRKLSHFHQKIKLLVNASN